MPRKKKNVEQSDQEQSARFLETAKAVQCEDAEEKFKKTVEKIDRKTEETYREC